MSTTAIDDSELHDHDGGLAHDLAVLMPRRRLIRMAGAAGLLALVGCGSESASGDATTGATTGVTTGATTGVTTPATTGALVDGACNAVPEETAGPYPGDGSNGKSVLTEADVVRSDIRSSIGSASGVAEGVDLRLAMTIVSVDGCSPMPGAAVYVWHADREGRYSMYSQGVTDENYLRGVQVAGDDGTVQFSTVFPGCYDGRWPHIHFEVFSNLDDALAASSPVLTSQIALPKDACEAAYQADGYSTSANNLSRTSLATDMVFSDGVATQLPIITGNASAGFGAALTVGV